MARPVLCQRFGSYVQRELNLSDADADVAAYGLESVGSLALPLIAVVLAGWLLDSLAATIMVTAVTAWLKAFAGGGHCKSLLHCSLLGGLAAGLLGRLATSAGPLAPQSFLLAFIIVAALVAAGTCWSLAPVTTTPIKDPLVRRRKRSRAVKAAAVAAFFALALLFLNRPQGATYAMAVGLALLWHSFFMTPAGRQTLHRMEKLLDFKRGEVN